MVSFISFVGIPKHVVGIAKHVVTTWVVHGIRFISLAGIPKHVVGITNMLLPPFYNAAIGQDPITHIVNRISNTSYHLQYLYCPGGFVFGAKPSLITCIVEFFLSVVWWGRQVSCPYALNENPDNAFFIGEFDSETRTKFSYDQRLNPTFKNNLNK